MTHREIATLVFRGVALFVAITTIGEFAVWPILVFQTAASGPWWSTILAGVGAAGPLLQVAIAVWLWYKAGVVAAWATGHDLQDEPDEPDVSPITADRMAVQEIVLSSIGVWVLVTAIPELFSSLASALAFVVRIPGNPEPEWNLRLAISSGRLLIHLALGFWLLYGAPSLTRWLVRMRSDRPA